jgi:uncharacterized protein DUF5335
MMQALELEQESWSEYFDAIEVNGREVLVTVRLLTRQTDAPCEEMRARWPLRAIAYDSGVDMFELAIGGKLGARPALRYFVSAPRRITVMETMGVKAILIDDASGQQTFVHLFDHLSAGRESGALCPAAPQAAPAEGSAGRAGAGNM